MIEYSTRQGTGKSICGGTFLRVAILTFLCRCVLETWIYSDAPNRLLEEVATKMCDEIEFISVKNYYFYEPL